MKIEEVRNNVNALARIETMVGHILAGMYAHEYETNWSIEEITEKAINQAIYTIKSLDKLDYKGTK